MNYSASTSDSLELTDTVSFTWAATAPDWAQIASRWNAGPPGSRWEPPLLLESQPA